MKRNILILLLALFAAESFAANEIDHIINKKLTTKQMRPSALCNDGVYVRRAYLIFTGHLPTAEQSLAFIDSEDENKREALNEQLLTSDDYVSNQVLKWGDLLKIKSEFPSNIWPNGVQAYNRWVRKHIAANTPYNLFVRDLLLSSGSNFRTPQVSFYRAFVRRTPQVIAENVELLFLGRRHPYAESAQFFAQISYKNTGEWKEEIVYPNLDIEPEKRWVEMDDGTKLTLKAGEDLRIAYVDWLTSPENRAFARVMANRVWYWMMGRGIVHEPDDFREDNPPTNKALLEHLTDEFIGCGYDTRALMAYIASSKAFQRSSLSNPTNGDDNTLFSHYPTRRLTAEQIIDGLSIITGINDRYVSKVPEPYSYYPADMLSSDIGDATVSSPQLDIFGRPSRDFSLESQRVTTFNAKQTLYLINSTSIINKLKNSNKIAQIVDVQPNRRDAITYIYLMMLSRRPTPQELKAITTYGEGLKRKRELAEDLVWALLNSPEYLFNH